MQEHDKVYIDGAWVPSTGSGTIDVLDSTNGEVFGRIPNGSAADVDAYLHAGGQWEWDSAAPAGVVWAAGLHGSRLDGAPLIYNRRDPYLPDLLMCRRELAEPLLTAIRSVIRGGPRRTP